MSKQKYNQDTVSCFTSKVDYYVKYRPHYPQGIIELLARDCGLTADAVIADIGAGTGFLSQLFLQNGNQVIAIEPNHSMRNYCQQYLAQYTNFSVHSGLSHDIPLDDASVDFIVCGQAFHLFDKEKTYTEFKRIAKDKGIVAIISNNFDIAESEVTRAYFSILSDYFAQFTDRCLNTNKEDHQEIDRFFHHKPYQYKIIKHTKLMHLDAAIGLFASFSMAPEVNTAEFDHIKAKITALFNKHQEDSQVPLHFFTAVHYGGI